MKLLKANTLYIYTDGSSYSSPRSGGMGVRYVYVDSNHEEVTIDFQPYGHQGATNNQMELLACVEALENISNVQIPVHYNRIEICTDSRYVVDNFQNAIYVWPNQKWLNRDARPILNVDHWKQLYKALKSAPTRVFFTWVKGHAKDEHNKAVDKTAKKSAKAFLKDPLALVIVRRKKTKEKAKIGSVVNSGQGIVVRIVTSEYLREQDLVRYRYEVMSPKSKYFGKVDFAFSSIILRDAHTYKVSFNKDAKNPRIVRLIKEIQEEK